jgi:hypothetical protein
VKNSCLFILLLWLCVIVPKSWAQSPGVAVGIASPVVGAATAKGASSLEGLWQGKLLMPGGALGLTISVIALTDGGYFVALDVPMQKLNRELAELQLVPGTS